ncbi:MAG: DNA translocase FtsK 4TM domain-containing protein, partial [Nitrospirae bacterium]|nr:DNA translocase FtsK 4TM domain-containing protein [Nitrospirota bacterium]
MVERIKRIKEEIAGVLSILSSIYLSLSLISHHIKDPVPFFRLTLPSEPIQNLGGTVGAYTSGWLIIFLGLGSFIIPFLIIAFGVKRLLGKEGHKIYLLGGILFIVSSSFMLSLFSMTFDIKISRYPDGIGGLIGKEIAYIANSLFSLPGAYIFSLSSFLCSIILLSPFSITKLVVRKRQRAKEKGHVIEESVMEEKMREKLEVIPSIQTEISPMRPKKIGGYELPSLELLKLYDLTSLRPSKEELLENSTLIEKKLQDFDVEGKITQVHPGPVVTMFEFEPAPGVKINRVVSLADDLALSLKAQSVRVSPIAGKSTLGIEVPNTHREIVSLREILSSEYFKKSSSKLTLGLGKDIFGRPIIADLLKMPHLLVAGATGSGKSVSINSMVISLLYKSTPSEVKMLMIDPKLLELSAYEEIPHLISPVITTSKEAADALKKIVIEMEQRYKVLAEKAARNIENYNAQTEIEEQMPYIVIFIDELADLMFSVAAEVEDAIARLAQMGRAAGIHLILATQRPSVDVITGIIKANFPARISFQVSSKIDSRTILDTHGAEQLLGKGDMLLMFPGTRIIRVHGAFITEEEIRAVTDFIKSQGKPDYSILEGLKETELEEDGATGERDELYLKAVEFAESVGEVSISSIQRRLKIGYNRAANIMELMEEDGLVGPPKGA